MFTTVKSVVSEKGQVVIPKTLREKMGIASGTVLDFTVHQGRLIAVKKDDVNPFTKWRRKGKLPFGGTTDEYLKAIRDDHRD
jgi:AbrB family looped-hinge helix DNA binding protein